MGASKRHKILSVEGIVSAMRPNREYQVGNLALAYGVANSHIRTVLNAAVEAGLVDRIRRRVGTCYRLVWSEPVNESNATPPPYRNLRLDTTMTDYDKTLRQNALLALETRK